MALRKIKPKYEYVRGSVYYDSRRTRYDPKNPNPKEETAREARIRDWKNRIYRKANMAWCQDQITDQQYESLKDMITAPGIADANLAVLTLEAIDNEWKEEHFG